MPKLEEYFPPSFWRQTDNGKFEVFVLNHEEGHYYSLGTYDFQQTARTIVEARTAGFCAGSRISTDE